jgi:hypothetical protein
VATKEQKSEPQTRHIEQATVMIMAEDSKHDGFVFYGEHLHLRVWANGEFQLEGEVRRKPVE